MKWGAGTAVNRRILMRLQMGFTMNCERNDKSTEVFGGCRYPANQLTSTEIPKSASRIRLNCRVRTALYKMPQSANLVKSVANKFGGVPEPEPMVPDTSSPVFENPLTTIRTQAICWAIG